MQKIYILSVLLIGCIACDGVEEAESADITELDAELDADKPQTEAAPLAALGKAETSEHKDDDAWSKSAPDPVWNDLTSAGKLNASCVCYTRCSSNGVGWTKLYEVGVAGGHNDCSGKATAFCLGKSPDYKYHSSFCV